MQLPEYYSLNDSYGDIPEKYYCHKYDVLPSKYTTESNYKFDVIEWFLQNGYSILFKSFGESVYYGLSAKPRKMSSNCMINEELKTIVKLNSDNRKEKTDLFSIAVFYDCADKEIDDIINWEEIEKYCDLTKSNISLVISEDGELTTKGYDLKVGEVDVVMSYGKGFESIHTTILNRLNTDNDKGIVLLHGDPGTGKTTYIKYLTKLIENKEVLFIPPSMADMLSDPQIIPFLMDHKNSILVIEDAENVISDRAMMGSSAGVSNILNLTDGILADCLGIQIVATFNMDRKKIDPALLRKGRLIAEHKFSKLTSIESDALLTHLGKQPKGEEMILADIYNVDDELIKSEETATIGFNR